MFAPLAVDFERLTWVYNSIEPFIWYVVAIGCWFGLPKYTTSRLRMLLVVLLVIFGTSDFYESKAWWTPWWLLLWKGAALLGLIAVVGAIARGRRAHAFAEAASPPDEP